MSFVLVRTFAMRSNLSASFESLLLDLTRTESPTLNSVCRCFESYRCSEDACASDWALIALARTVSSWASGRLACKSTVDLLASSDVLPLVECAWAKSNSYGEQPKDLCVGVFRDNVAIGRIVSQLSSASFCCFKARLSFSCSY